VPDRRGTRPARTASATRTTKATPAPTTAPTTEPIGPPEPGRGGVGRGRIIAFAVIVVVAVAGATGYVLKQASDRDKAERAAASADARTPKLDVTAVAAVPHLVARSTALGPTYGMVVLVPRSAPGGPRAVTDLPCDRIYADSAGGLCLAANRGAITTYSGQILDKSLTPTGDVKITGGPSRARVSADGRYVASTVFVSGHSYTDVGFSTVTEIVDTSTGRGLGNLETWALRKDGQPYHAADVNYWGVTFADDNTFYATVGTHNTTFLVRGDIARRELVTIHENVECPSLSPDGKLIAYKRATGGASARHWRFSVLDLATGVETPLPEQRSIDDQLAWLDDSHVMYGAPRGAAGSAQTDVWVSPVPGRATGDPHVLIPDAESPAAVG
jgi:hypothetical protein